MRRLRLRVVAAIICAAAALVPATPASASTIAGVGVFVDIATVNPGLWFPAGLCTGIPLPNPPGGTAPVCPPTNAIWNFSSDSDVILSVTASDSQGTLNTFVIQVAANPLGAPWLLPEPFARRNRISGNGTLLGLCDGSVGSGIAQVQGHSAPVTFVTVGGTGVLVGLDGLVGTVVAMAIQLRPLPTIGLVPCLDHAATNFIVTGVAAVAAI